MKELDIVNRKTQQTMKTYSMENTAHRRATGGCLDKGRGQIVDPGANKEAVFKSGQPDFQSERAATQNDSLDVSILVSLKKHWIQRPTPKLTYFRSYGIEKWTVTTHPYF
jgi:hypothetical protein